MLELVIEHEALLGGASIQKPAGNHDLRTQKPEHRRTSVGSDANGNALYQSSRAAPMQPVHAKVDQPENNQDHGARKKPGKWKQSLDGFRDAPCDATDDASRGQLECVTLGFDGPEKAVEDSIFAGWRELAGWTCPGELGAGRAGRLHGSEQSQARNQDQHTECGSPNPP